MRRLVPPVAAALTLATVVAMPWVRAQAPATVTVDVTAARRPIDPRVYGVNFASRPQLEALNVPLNRWGGNSTTRYNWQLNADNRANDWYYQSIASGGATPAGSMDTFVTDTKGGGAEPMLTIPTIGWVAKLGPGRGKLASYSIAKYGAQTGSDWQWFPDAGNGIRASDGTAIVTNDPSDANIPADSTFQKGLVQHMVGRWGAAGAGGVRYYLLDNEPSLWSSTHRDVHDAGPTMDEVRDYILDYGARIKEADPAAVIAGPEEWGWSGYFFSGHDQQYGSQHGWGFLPDRANHGNADYLPWLLDQLRQHQQTTGQKLLDVFTVHYYPQGGEYGGGADSAMQLRRNRSTRSLWDPAYTDETWIGDKVRLIPRLREWVNGHYLPGTPIGITEYSWGADDSIGGATAQADVLGIFGREGLDLATRWVVPDTATPTFKAFQMYRNYDGNRSTFGDVSVAASGPNPDQTAVFAAQRSADGALTVMVVNKVLSGTTPLGFNVANFPSGGVASVYRLAASNQISRLPDVTFAGTSFSATLPAQSVTLFVLPAATAPSLTVSDASVTEGATGTTNATFTVNLSAPSAMTVTAAYATVAGTATDGTDLLPATGTLTFLPGETSKSVPVAVKGDADVEPDETFYLSLSAPANALIGDGQGTGTIRNDDVAALAVGTEYSVSPTGNDANPCTAVAPCRQIRRALSLVTAGDTILVADGSYLGFDVDDVHGAAGAPITIKARGTGAMVTPTTDRSDNRDTIFVTFSSYIVIDGLRSSGANRAAVRVDQSPNVTVRNGVFSGNGTWGIFTDFADDLLLENNECFGSVAEHGIYVSNSGDRPVLRRNRVHDNNASGIQLNADLSAGGDGIITGALIEANVIYNNGVAGGAAINLDGVQNSIVRNNVLYGNRSTGIVNYQGDGAAGPQGMKILHNTVDMPTNGRWALLINNTTGPNLVRNNILYNRHAFRGAITYGTPADVANTDSDYNVLDRVSQDDGNTVLTLAQWKAQGHELHSFSASDTDLWVSATAFDYHLKAGSPAIDQGPALADATRDREGHIRPWGVGSDLGADEVVAANFVTTSYVSGLSNPTAMQFAPDGRLFVCQQGGMLRVVKNGGLLAAPFVNLTVDSNGERGLLGVAFDPDFATNQFVYVYYTVPGSTPHNRVSRFTANGDVAAAGSETIILELNNLSSATNHNGGALHFGPDGRLYIAVGENANGNNAQSMTNLLGKMLRINRDGTIPADNPFFGTATGQNRAIWALGLRNPFTFDFQPGTGRMFINDVGQNTWEEINDGIAGSNYGWPTTEGMTTMAGFRSPLYVYNHTTGNPTGCAITGGAFYNPTTVQFPADYIGDFFFADFCSGFIWRFDPTVVPPATQAFQFLTGINSPVDLKVTDDGSLFYLARGAGAVFRVQNTASQAPVITGQPSNVTVTVGNPASFSVTASGQAPLAYQWQRNGTDITGATASTYTIASPQLSDNGARFRCRVTNTLGTATSAEAVLTVTANTAPTASITQPASGTLYTAGDTVNYAGTGTDTQDGTLPASAFTWQVDFHHDTHIHPFVPATTGSTSGSFTIPTSGETSANVWYRIHLTVRDSGGLTHEAIRDVLPRKADVTLQTSPAGLQLLLDGQPQTAPTTFTGVTGIVRSLEAPSPQTVGGTTYQFVSWSDGGARAHTVSTPAANTTYTATFQVVTAAALTCPTSPVPPNGSYNTTVNAGTSAKDWVAQYTPGSPNTPWIGQWKYVPLPRPATVTMTAPSVGGMYVLRLFANDGFTVIGSCSFQVVATPALSINDVTVTEGNASTVNASFTVTLSPTSSAAVTVNWATADGTATQPSDYTPGSGSLTFAPGESTKTVTVAVNGDTTAEASETFFVNLSGASGASLADGQGQGTIVNDDGAGTALTCPTSSVPPGGSYTATVNAGSSAKDWVAQYTPGSPNNPWIGQFKYVPLPRPTTVTMTAPATAGTYELRLFANDTFTSIGSCTVQVGAVGSALSIADVTVTEGNTGTVNANFTVTLSPTASGIVTVNWSTANGTATQPSDYVAASGTLTFAPGEATKTVTVAVNGDASSEVNETFFVNLTGASGASVSDAQGQGTIINDDGTPPVLTCPTSAVTRNTSYTATVAGGSSAKDWVAQYTPGSPNNVWTGQWQYVPLPRPATVTMTAPGTPGSYELRLLANDGFTAIGSCPIVVQ